MSVGVRREVNSPCTTTSGLGMVEKRRFRGSISPGARSPLKAEKCRNISINKLAPELQTHSYPKKLLQRLMGALQLFVFLEATPFTAVGNTSPPQRLGGTTTGESSRQVDGAVADCAHTWPSNGSPRSKGFRGCTKTGPTSEDIYPSGSSPRSEGSRTPPLPGFIGEHTKINTKTNMA